MLQKKLKNNRVLDVLKKTITTRIWPDSARFSLTPSQLTRALLISSVGQHHMGTTELSPIWGYVLNSLYQPGREGGGEGD